MASYLIFVEGVKRSDTEGLTEELGIAEAEGADSRMMWSQVMEGPGGQPGLVGGWMQQAIQPMYKPAVQTWQKAPGGKFWVGVWKEWPVKPEDLLRAKSHERSYPIKLEDGNDWAIPVARWLPHRWGMNDAGEGCRIPAPEFADFCRQAEAVYQAFVQAGVNGGPLLIESDWGYVCKALSLNYRLAPPIISVLGLVGDACGGSILSATVEWAWIAAVDAEKKNAELATTPATPST